MQPERLSRSLGALDPGKRALLKLSLREGVRDEDLAQLTGAEPVEIVGRRAEAMARIGADLSLDSPEEFRAAQEALAGLPEEEWAGPAGQAPRAGGREKPPGDEAEGAGDETERGESGAPAEAQSRARRFLFENGLSIFFGAIFLAALTGQAIAGHKLFNEEELEHGGDAITFGRYLTSSSFGQAVMENWQSEYLQFTLYMLATIWFLQKGSPESKDLGKAGRESDREQRVGPHAGDESPRWARLGGWRTRIYSNSLLLLMLAIFLGSWLAQSLTGWSDYNAEQMDHEEETVSWIGFLGTPNFWESTFQNWQSEFLAVGSFAVFAIFLRQRGSSESKPVGASHEATGLEG